MSSVINLYGQVPYLWQAGYFRSFSGYRPPREILFRYISTEFKSVEIPGLPRMLATL